MKIQLLQIAHARSGDKGDTGNVGIIARKPEYYPIIKKICHRRSGQKTFCRNMPRESRAIRDSESSCNQFFIA